MELKKYFEEVKEELEAEYEFTLENFFICQEALFKAIKNKSPNLAEIEKTYDMVLLEYKDIETRCVAFRCEFTAWKRKVGIIK